MPKQEPNSFSTIDLSTILPPELFETILRYLDLDAVKALRLTDKGLAEKCLGPRFLATIEQQPTIDVSLENLRSLHALACNPVLGKRVHSLTFLATGLDSSGLEQNVGSKFHLKRESKGPFFEITNTTYTPKGLSSAKVDLKWLREQQTARVNESLTEMAQVLQLALEAFGEVASIHLDGAQISGLAQRKPTADDKWPPIWTRASFVFSLVLKAIVQSRVSVKSLDAYCNTPSCFIPSDHITTYASGFNATQLEMLSKCLESFELSMSGGVPDALDTKSNEESSNEERDPVAALANGTQGIVSLLRSAPALRELRLTFRHASRGEKPGDYDHIIESIAHETRFPLLERCSLLGFPAKEESILLFLQKHPHLRSLTLHECTLTTGSWTPIFSYLEQSMPRLESLSFSTLVGKHMQNRQCKMAQGRQRLNAREEGKDEDEQEVYGIVNLSPIWDTNAPLPWTSVSNSAGILVHTRSFNCEELKKGLVFRPYVKRGQFHCSPEMMDWVRYRKAFYGPL